LGNLVASRTQDAVRAHRDKQVLLDRVKSSWIEGVLEQVEAVYAGLGVGLIELHKRLLPKAVDQLSDADDEISFLETEPESATTDQKVGEIFQDMDRSLLILGGPGSGKTIALLELAREAIAAAEQDLDQPIPVVLNLSSWADDRTSMANWIAQELSTTKYSVPKGTGQRWIENNELVLLLDGLDEVLSRDQEACVRAINRFVEAHGLTRIAVCCRTQEYNNLRVRLKLRGAMQLESLTTTQIDDYFEAAGASLHSLHSALHGDAPLRELAKIPLMLSIMSVSYQDMTMTELTGGQLDSEEARRKHLFDTYVQRMFKRKAQRDKSYSDAQTKKWLSWLARRMDEQRQTTLLIDELQPTWLPSRAWHWTYMIVSRLSVGLMGSLIGGLIVGAGLGAYTRFRIPLRLALLRGLVEGLTGGLIAGITVGLVDMAWMLRMDKGTGGRQRSTL
jgi:hypothetical protein